MNEQMNQQTESKATRTSRRPTETEATKSLTDVITENLGEDTVDQIQSTISQASAAISSTKEYLRTNRSEALILAAAVGGVAWAVLYTKAGRNLFEAIAPTVVPKIADYVTQAVSTTTRQMQ